MFEEYENKKRKQISRMRAIMDAGMGILIFFLGVFFFFRNKLDISFNKTFPPDNIDKILGAMCMVYGTWRMYRAYKKKYFK